MLWQRKFVHILCQVLISEESSAGETDMILLIVFLGSLLVGVMAAVVAHRMHLAVSRPVRYGAGFLGLLGAISLASGALELEHALATRHWPSTHGVIIRNEVVGERAYHPNIVYRYLADGRLYVDSTDLDQPSFGGRQSRREVAYKRSVKYRVGDTVIIHYNPRNPSESRLRTVPSWSAYGKTGFGSVCIMLGLLFGLGAKTESNAHAEPRR
jgi:hypothetical protein